MPSRLGHNSRVMPSLVYGGFQSGAEARPAVLRLGLGAALVHQDASQRVLLMQRLQHLAEASLQPTVTGAVAALGLFTSVMLPFGGQ